MLTADNISGDVADDSCRNLDEHNVVTHYDAHVSLRWRRQFTFQGKGQGSHREAWREPTILLQVGCETGWKLVSVGEPRGDI